MFRFEFRESHPYKPHGFETMNSKIGEDPITEIRTMKNRLRKLAVSSTLNNNQVKVWEYASALTRMLFV